MIARSLNSIGIRRRRPRRLTRAALLPSTILSRPRHALRSLHIPLLLSSKAPHATSLLTGELPAARSIRHGAIPRLSLSASRLVVRDYVVRCALVVAALAVCDALVLLVVFGVLQDDVPGVEQAGKYAETAECDVDE